MNEVKKKELYKTTLVESPSGQEYFSTPVSKLSTQIGHTNKHTIVVQNNNKKNSTRATANLFTEDIFDYFTSFEITSEESLSEFWEFYLLGRDIELGEISHVLKTVFALGELQLEREKASKIVVEESDTKQYVTISELNISVNTIQALIHKNHFDGNYRMGYGKVSFEVSLALPHQVIVQNEVNNAYVMQSTKEVSGEFHSRSLQVQTTQRLAIFEEIDKEDLLDLEEDTRCVNALFNVLQSERIRKEEIVDISYRLAHIGSTLSTYNELYPVAQAFSELSNALAKNFQNFMKNAKILVPMCKIFADDMNTWINKLFYIGAPSIDFMHENIVTNCQTISGIIKEQGWTLE